MRRVFLIRHGAIGGDAAARFVGRSDLAMNAEGEAQMRAIAERLAERITLETIFASDLGRSRRAAELIAAGRSTPIRVRPALAEIDMGAWDGLLRRDVAAAQPEAYAERGRDMVHFRPPGGESFADVAERVLPVWRSIVEAEGGDRLVVGHAGVNRVILTHVLGMPLENLFRIVQDPACVNVIEWAGGNARVRLLDGPSGPWPW